MNKPINESKLTIQLEVITELWIRAENQPLDFYEEFAGLLIQFDEIYWSGSQYFGKRPLSPTFSNSLIPR